MAKHDAYRSGMRGAEKPVAQDEEAAATDQGGADENYGDVVKQHVHGPDENGHHHLNLTTLAEHLGKHGR